MAYRGRYGDERRGGSRTLRVLLLIVILAAGVWFAGLFARIQQVARTDEAKPADAIAVFGAAQYVGRPSPVFHARLDHAVSLYRKQLAPMVITLGGAGDAHEARTEGAVGRDYLLGQGVPYDRIIAETESTNTEEQAQSLAQIARARGYHRVIAVSDGTHLFRIRALCAEEGLTVMTSPRPAFGTLSGWGYTTRVLHEMVSYTLLQLHFDAAWVHRWVEGREDA